MARSERLSPVEAIMWRAGHDATLKMTVGNVVILDRVPDQKALAERLAVAADVRRPGCGGASTTRHAAAPGPPGWTGTTTTSSTTCATSWCPTPGSCVRRSTWSG